tara:strand:- start:4510 stop:5913 length:1404 start_codon:yes stop_codon:yes gene_type:complete
MKRKRLAYIISHGHTARGALQTGLLEKLSADFEVVVIANSSALDALNELHEKGIIVYAFDQVIDRLDQQKSILRSHIHQNIRNNPALWEKHLQRTRNKKNSLKRRLLNHTYYYIGHVFRIFPAAQAWFEKSEQKRYFKADAANLLKKISIDSIISTRPVDEMESYLLEAARQLNIHRIFYILSWDNISSKGIFPVLGNSYLTWGPIMNKELKEYYDIQDSAIYNTGVTHFDVHAQVRDGILHLPDLLQSIGLNDHKPYLFFTMSASYFAPNEIDIVEHIAAKIESDFFGDSMQLIIRPHMANLMADRSDQSWLKRLKNLNSARVKVDFPDSDNSLLTWYMAKDDMIRLSSLLNGASVCLNSGSTVAIEAIYLDKPVIITAFDTEQWPYWSSARRLLDYVHLQKLFNLKACTLADSLDTMDASIQAYLNDINLHSKERQNAIEQECYKNDGKATERFVENVSQIMQGL